jgi:hypothetical protein
MNGAALQHLPRQFGRTAVHHHLCADGCDDVVEQADREDLVDGVDRGERSDTADPARQGGRQQGFVELHHDRDREPARQLRAVHGHPFGQRGSQIAQRSGIGDRTVPAGQLQFRGQGDGAGDLHLDGAPLAGRAGLLPGLLQSIDVLGEQACRPAGDGSGTRRDPVPARHGVDGDVHQQPTGPADHVRADAASG